MHDTTRSSCRGSFEELRRSGAVYVDKTDLIFELLYYASKGFQLARPDGFGKSLLLDTIKTFFTKGLEPFAGLKLEKLMAGRSAKRYPVMLIDFACFARAESGAEFEQALSSCLRAQLQKLQLRDQEGRMVEIDDEFYGADTPPDSADLAQDIFSAVPECSLVLLIDNLSAPLEASRGIPELQEAIFCSISQFLCIMRVCHPHFRFILVTGNNIYEKYLLEYAAAQHKFFIRDDTDCLLQISQEKCWQSVLGFTLSEVQEYFSAELEFSARALECSKEEVMTQLMRCCPRYEFAENNLHKDLSAQHVFSPEDILRFFADPRVSLTQAGQSVLPVKKVQYYRYY